MLTSFYPSSAFAYLHIFLKLQRYRYAHSYLCSPIYKPTLPHATQFPSPYCPRPPTDHWIQSEQPPAGRLPGSPTPQMELRRPFYIGGFKATKTSRSLTDTQQNLAVNNSRTFQPATNCLINLFSSTLQDIAVLHSSRWNVHLKQALASSIRSMRCIHTATCLARMAAAKEASRYLCTLLR